MLTFSVVWPAGTVVVFPLAMTFHAAEVFVT